MKEITEAFMGLFRAYVVALSKDRVRSDYVLWS